VVRDERREPARPLAAQSRVADVRRRRGLDRIDPDPARPPLRVADLADEPADEVGSASWRITRPRRARSSRAPSVAVELPVSADLGRSGRGQVADDQLLVVGVADVADELAARVDEVALAVEVVVAELLDADPVDRADEVAVGDRVRRLLELPQVLDRPATVADGLKTISAPFSRAPARPRGSGGRSRCRRRPCRPRSRRPGSRGCRAGSRTSPRSP
jgi:hypothetical protein